MMKKIAVSIAVAAALLTLASTKAVANPAEGAPKTLACFSLGTQCDNNGTCCSGLCSHHRCVKN